MFMVTQHGEHGSHVSNVAHSEGEMLDRVRYALQSEYVVRVEVTRW